MADESKEPAPVPLGAQVLKRMYSAMKALHGECSKAVGALDACEAKDLINEHLTGYESSMTGMGKAFAKMYKGVDLEDKEEEKKPNEKEPDADDDDLKKEPEPQIKAVDDTDDSDPADDGMSPTEKAMLLSRIRQTESRIRQTESRIRHEERLQRMARLRAAN